MTKEEIRRAIREAQLSGRKDNLVEAFKIMYRYGLVKGSDMMRLMEVLEKA
jgi:hypothetical protein